MDHSALTVTLALNATAPLNVTEPATAELAAPELLYPRTNRPRRTV
ncbi:hypothetical protein [Streptomyces lavendulocolor]